MPAQLHQVSASAQALEFVGRNRLAALAFAAAAALGLWRGTTLNGIGPQLLVIGMGSLFAVVALALAIVRQRLTLALDARTYTRWRRFGRLAGIEQGSLDEVTGVAIDVRADYDTNGGTPVPHWVVLLEFKDPAKQTEVARFTFSASASKAYAYAIELARRLRTSFIDRAGFEPRVAAWTELDKPMARGAANRPFPALPAGSAIALSGDAPERRIGLPGAGRPWLAIIPEAFCAGVMLLGLAGLFGIIGAERFEFRLFGEEVDIWWLPPLVFATLGLFGLVAVILSATADMEIRETASSLVFIERYFRRPWRAIEVAKTAIIVIEHRLDPFRVRAGRHEVLIRAPGRVLRIGEGGPTNADLAWLERALLAMV